MVTTIQQHTDIAADLKRRFWLFEYDLLEWWDHLGFPSNQDPDPEWTEADQHTVSILGTLGKTVDAMPDEQLKMMKALRERNPAAFEQAATSLTKAVGVTFFPEDAASFCEALSDGLK